MARSQNKSGFGKSGFGANFGQGARGFKDFANLASGAAGMLSSLGDQIQDQIKTRFELFMADLDIVTREEFDVVSDQLKKARMEQETLKRRLEVLEGKKAKPAAAKTKLKSKPAAKSTKSIAAKGKKKK